VKFKFLSRFKVFDDNYQVDRTTAADCAITDLVGRFAPRIGLIKSFTQSVVSTTKPTRLSLIDSCSGSSAFEKANILGGFRVPATPERLSVLVSTIKRVLLE
jgi:hypothetical protein